MNDKNQESYESYKIYLFAIGVNDDVLRRRLYA